eukprot:3212001-Rhodomonas_salina.1
MVLRAYYAVSGTELAYGATQIATTSPEEASRLRDALAGAPFTAALSAGTLGSYQPAMLCGTEIAYGATRCA